MVRLGKVSIAVQTFGVCDFSRLAVTDWRLRIGGYGLALAALALVVFGAYDSYPSVQDVQLYESPVIRPLIFKRLNFPKTIFF